jgi:hypothetical protein
MPRLEDLKGKDIVILLLTPLMDQTRKVIATKLVEIEISGLWLEGKDVAKSMHETHKLAIIPRMPLFFVPFAQIGWIMGSSDYPSLSEEHLGL